MVQLHLGQAASREHCGAAQRCLRVGHVTDRSTGQPCPTAVCSAPDVPNTSEHRSYAALSSTELSRAGKARKRYKLRAFFQGLRCGNGPPGLHARLNQTIAETTGPGLPEATAATGTEYFRMDEEDTEEEEDGEATNDGIGTGVCAVATNLGGNWTHLSGCYKTACTRQRRPSTQEATTHQNTTGEQEDRAVRGWSDVMTTTQPSLQGSDMSDECADLPPPSDDETLDAADAVLRLNLQMDVTLRVAIRAEDEGMLLTGKMMKQIIMDHTDHEEDNAATIIGALVDLGGLDVLEEADEDDDDAVVQVSADARNWSALGGPIMEKLFPWR